MRPITQSSKLAGVRYDVRGPILQEAERLERAGHEILKLNIGNPTSATFPGLKLNVVWANSAPGTKNYDPSTRQTKEISIPGEIKPGMWNTEEIVLAPAKPDQIDYLTIKPSAPSVILRTSAERK